MARFCLLHGAWHDATCWEPLARELRARGHEVVAPDLPLDDPHTGYEERIAPAVDALEGAEEHVVVVGHSMGAGYAPYVAAALPGAALVLLCPGFSRLRASFPWPAARPDGTTVWDPATAVDALYGRLDRDTAHALATKLRPMAPPSDAPPPKPDLPATVIYASADELFDPEREREKLARRPENTAIEIPGGHLPMLEDPAALGALLDRIAGD